MSKYSMFECNDLVVLVMLRQDCIPTKYAMLQALLEQRVVLN